jgi:hypothetical protein
MTEDAHSYLFQGHSHAEIQRQGLYGGQARHHLAGATFITLAVVAALTVVAVIFYWRYQEGEQARRG